MWVIEHRNLRGSQQDPRVATACSMRIAGPFARHLAGERFSYRPRRWKPTVPPAPPVMFSAVLQRGRLGKKHDDAVLVDRATSGTAWRRADR